MFSQEIGARAVLTLTDFADGSFVAFADGSFVDFGASTSATISSYVEDLAALAEALMAGSINMLGTLIAFTDLAAGSFTTFADGSFTALADATFADLAKAGVDMALADLALAILVALASVNTLVAFAEADMVFTALADAILVAFAEADMSLAFLADLAAPKASEEKRGRG